MTQIKNILKFQEDVSKFSNCKAHAATGNLDGEDSVSSVLLNMRYAGWKNLGSLGNFEDALVEAGFKLRVIYVGRGTRRVYVSTN